jgi:predicted O-linked N-acetylglucosamine transferase (SPINDLY family)
MPVQSLDGVFLAAKAETLQRKGVRFDPRFAFHHYDLDFCCSAIQAGLSLGTWPLQLTHASSGNATGAIWDQSARIYQCKWGELSPSVHPRQTTPSQPQGLFRSARALEKVRAWTGAEKFYRQLLQLSPNHGPAQLQLANVLHRQNRPLEAIRSLNTLLQKADSSCSNGLRARAQTNRGALLQLQGDLDGAVADHSEALRLEPSLTIAGDNLLALAMQLRSLGFTHQALEALRVILRATPQRPDLLLQLGSTLMELGRVEAAVPCFRRLLRQRPELPEGHYQLGQALASLGHTEAGLQALKTAHTLAPEASDVLTSLEWHRLSLCDWDDYDRRAARVLSQLQRYAESSDGRLVAPLTASLFALPPALHRRLGERWSQPTRDRMAHRRLPPPQNRENGQRLRIGYLSADFRDHAVGHLIHGLFSQHDRRRFEVFAYSLSNISDPINAAIRKGVDHFKVVAEDSSEAIVQQIRADGIDVLIDLMGHTHHGRPDVLARRPAPLQLHYLGYPGSLGADWIDGVIADTWLIPPEHDSHYKETVHRLPWAFVSSSSLNECSDAARPVLTRNDIGLPENAVVFACFHRPEKITPKRFNCWLEILHQVPDAVLWVINDQPLVEERLIEKARAAGMAPQRLVFSPKLESALFTQACSLADLLLDTSPYSSGATAVTALAAGLPLLTCPGDSFVSRMGASLCAATGLNELICSTPEAYQQKAIELGRQPAELRRLQHQLLDRHDELPLFNTAAWVGHFEKLLEQIFV